MRKRKSSVDGHVPFGCRGAVLLCVMLVLSLCAPDRILAGEMDSPSADSSDPVLERYVGFFEEVYQSFADNYYKIPSRESFDAFLESFRSQIYSQLLQENKSNDYVRWRSAALMVERLRDPEDVFSAFYPPKPAKEYEGTALAMTIEVEDRMELGVQTRAIPEGRVVTFVEPRSDAYEKGLRENDLIARIDEKICKASRMKRWRPC